MTKDTTIVPPTASDEDLVWWTAITSPCPWCDRVDCPERDAHERFDRASESTWRQAVAA